MYKISICACLRFEWVLQYFVVPQLLTAADTLGHFSLFTRMLGIVFAWRIIFRLVSWLPNPKLSRHSRTLYSTYSLFFSKWQHIFNELGYLIFIGELRISENDGCYSYTFGLVEKTAGSKNILTRCENTLPAFQSAQSFCWKKWTIHVFLHYKVSVMYTISKP